MIYIQHRPIYGKLRLPQRAPSRGAGKYKRARPRNPNSSYLYVVYTRVSRRKLIDPQTLTFHSALTHVMWEEWTLSLHGDPFVHT